MTNVGVLPALSPDGAAAAGSALGSDLPLSWHAATTSTGTRIARIEGTFRDDPLPATGVWLAGTYAHGSARHKSGLALREEHPHGRRSASGAGVERDQPDRPGRVRRRRRAIERVRPARRIAAGRGDPVHG